MKKIRKNNPRKKITIDLFVCDNYLLAHKDFKYKLQKATQKQLDIDVANYFAKNGAKSKRKSFFERLKGVFKWKKKKSI